MAKSIRKVKKGETPCMLDEGLANEVIALCNAVLLARVVPDGCGTVVIGGESMQINLSGLKQQIDSMTSKLDTIINALKNPQFSISCNGDGTITAKLSFPI